MGVVSDLVSNVGHMFGIGGGMNQFNAQGANLPQMDYATAIKQAMTNAGGISGQQQNLASQLQSQAAGNGPSIAQPMLQQATDQNTQQAAGMIASQRGMNAGNAQRQIADSRAGIQQQGAQQMALLRNQEQLGAQGMLGHTLGVMGQQNLGMLGAAGSMNQGQNSLALENALGSQQINAGVARQNADITSRAIGGALNGAGAAMGMGSTGGGGGGGGFPIGGAGGVSAESPLGGASYFAGGGRVPGQAEAPGDSPENDTVDAELSPGEIVLPRSVAQAENAPELAAEFVRAVRRKSYAQGGVAGYAAGGKVPEQGYGKVLALSREHEKRLKLIEAKLMTRKESARVSKYAEGKK